MLMSLNHLVCDDYRVWWYNNFKWFNDSDVSTSNKIIKLDSMRCVAPLSCNAKEDRLDIDDVCLDSHPLVSWCRLDLYLQRFFLQIEDMFVICDITPYNGNIYISHISISPPWLFPCFGHVGLAFSAPDPDFSYTFFYFLGAPALEWFSLQLGFPWLGFPAVVGLDFD